MTATSSLVAIVAHASHVAIHTLIPVPPNADLLGAHATRQCLVQRRPVADGAEAAQLVAVTSDTPSRLTGRTANLYVEIEAETAAALHRAIPEVAPRNVGVHLRSDAAHGARWSRPDATVWRSLTVEAWGEICTGCSAIHGSDAVSAKGHDAVSLILNHTCTALAFSPHMPTTVTVFTPHTPPLPLPTFPLRHSPPPPGGYTQFRSLKVSGKAVTTRTAPTQSYATPRSNTRHAQSFRPEYS